MAGIPRIIEEKNEFGGYCPTCGSEHCGELATEPVTIGCSECETRWIVLEKLGDKKKGQLRLGIIAEPDKPVVTVHGGVAEAVFRADDVIIVDLDDEECEQ